MNPVNIMTFWYHILNGIIDLLMTLDLGCLALLAVYWKILMKR